jgi:hypothetical protein
VCDILGITPCATKVFVVYTAKLTPVCAGLTSNHWHKEFIPGNASSKMTPDDEMSVEKCISVLLGSKSMTDDPGVKAAPKTLVRSRVELPNQ